MCYSLTRPSAAVFCGYFSPHRLEIQSPGIINCPWRASSADDSPVDRRAGGCLSAWSVFLEERCAGTRDDAAAALGLVIGCPADLWESAYTSLGGFEGKQTLFGRLA